MAVENSVVFDGKDESIRYAAAVLFRNSGDAKLISNKLAQLYLKISSKILKFYGNGFGTSIKSDHMVGYTISSRHAALRFLAEADKLMRDHGYKVVFNHTRIKNENEYSFYYCLSLADNDPGFSFLTFFNDEKWEESHDYEFVFPYPEEEGKRIILAGNRTRTEQYHALNRELQYYRENNLLKGEVWTKPVKSVSGKVIEVLADSFFPMN